METACYELDTGTLALRFEGECLTGLVLRKGPAEEKGTPTAFSDRVCRQVREYLEGTREEFEIPCRLEGTPFQLEVWQALETIPRGETRTYGEIARQIGREGAARAVGRACGSNPVWIIVPCHRAVGADGSLTGYAGGLELKKRLLDLEQSRAGNGT